MKTTLLPLLLFLLLATQVSALGIDPPTSLKVVEKDFPIFKDADYKILYIDFELLITNVKSVKVVKDEKEIAFKKNLSDVAVDAIYEINYSDYAAGNYRLELETYTGEILKSNFNLE